MITFFYFFLLIYTIAALAWWGILLYQQNNEITLLKKQNLILQKDETLHPAGYPHDLEQINKENRLRNFQYLGEGGTFLIIILLSAGFVYSAMRRQIRFSRQQQNFMMAVTHELKSPIAIIRLNLETLQRRKLNEDQQKTFYSNTLGEINRLNRLCNNMLLASQFESRQYHVVKESVNLSELLTRITKESISRSAHHVFKSNITDNIWVKGDPLMLQIASNNLIENAIKYAPKGSSITIGLSKENDHILLQVKDQGEGIPVNERKKIFSRFYRIGNENTRKAKGTGLGLFLTKKIVEQHGGHISVMDNTPKGSIFEITLQTTG